jgi:hypothetical protein
MIMERADTKALSWSPSDRKPVNHDQSAFSADSRVEPIPLGSSGQLAIARAHFWRLASSDRRGDGPCRIDHEDAAALRKMAAASRVASNAGSPKRAQKLRRCRRADRSGMRHQQLTRSLTFRPGTGARSTLLQPAWSAGRIG